MWTNAFEILFAILFITHAWIRAFWLGVDGGFRYLIRCTNRIVMCHKFFPKENCQWIVLILFFYNWNSTIFTFFQIHFQFNFIDWLAFECRLIVKSKQIKSNQKYQMSYGSTDTNGLKRLDDCKIVPLTISSNKSNHVIMLCKKGPMPTMYNIEILLWMLQTLEESEGEKKTKRERERANAKKAIHRMGIASQMVFFVD